VLPSKPSRPDRDDDSTWQRASSFLLWRCGRYSSPRAAASAGPVAMYRACRGCHHELLGSFSRVSISSLSRSSRGQDGPFFRAPRFSLGLFLRCSLCGLTLPGLAPCLFPRRGSVLAHSALQPQRLTFLGLGRNISRIRKPRLLARSREAASRLRSDSSSLSLARRCRRHPSCLP